MVYLELHLSCLGFSTRLGVTRTSCPFSCLPSQAVPALPWAFRTSLALSWLVQKSLAYLNLSVSLCVSLTPSFSDPLMYLCGSPPYSTWDPSS